MFQSLSELNVESIEDNYEELGSYMDYFDLNKRIENSLPYKNEDNFLDYHNQIHPNHMYIEEGKEQNEQSEQNEQDEQIGITPIITRNKIIFPKIYNENFTSFENVPNEDNSEEDKEEQKNKNEILNKKRNHSKENEKNEDKNKKKKIFEFIEKECDNKEYDAKILSNNLNIKKKSKFN